MACKDTYTGIGMEIISGIYRITNRWNGDFYIGRSKDIYWRFYQHRRSLRRGCHVNKKLQKAWNRYGEIEFEFDIIIKCAVEESKLLERTEIKKWWNRRCLYNIGKNHDGNQPRGVSCFDDDGEIVLSFSSLGNASRRFNVDTSAISMACRGAGGARKIANYFWAYKGEEPVIRNKFPDPKMRMVIGWKKETGECVGFFESAEEAGRILKLPKTKHIACVCRGRRKSTYGYVFRYADSE